MIRPDTSRAQGAHPPRDPAVPPLARLSSTAPSGTRKLYFTALALLVFIGGGAGLLLSHQLSTWAEEALGAELTAQARAAAALWQDECRSRELAATLTAATGTRVELFPMAKRDAAITADATAGDTARAECAGGRTPGEPPGDAAEAARTGRPVSRQSSSGELMVFVPSADGRVVARAARANPPSSGGHLGWALAIAGAVGLAIARVMSGLAAGLAARELRNLAEAAANLARGERHRLSTEAGAELGALAGSFNKLSEQLQLRLAELAASRSRLEAVLETMGEAILVLDDDRRIRLANAAARDVFELEEHPEGRALVDVIRSPALHRLVEVASAADNAADEAPEGAASPEGEFELSARGAPGAPRTRLIQARCRRLRDDQGLLVVADDVTEIRRLETIRRDFVANVSHELRTPVAVIRANAETLAAGGLGDAKRAPGFVAGIHRNAERLASLISDLLDLSRIESGRWAVDPMPLYVAPIAQRVAAALAPAAESRKSSILMSIAASARALGDPRAIEQILANLVENALKHSPEGCTVELTAELRDGCLRIWVTDDGPGISTPHRDRVFERFYRVDPGRSRAVGGTGLGLSIVRHLAEAMSGAAGLEPREPHGCRFWLELPAAPT